MRESRAPRNSRISDDKSEGGGGGVTEIKEEADGMPKSLRRDSLNSVLLLSDCEGVEEEEEDDDDDEVRDEGRSGEAEED